MNILLCAGTRPNLVKIAPLFHQAVKNNVEADILYTGQHYDYNLSDVFFKQFRLPNPSVKLEIEKSEGDEYIKEVADAVERYLKTKRYDFVITVGDVNSTLGCAIGGNNAKHRVVHVESGLRSHDLNMPEEINRVEVDRVADIKFVSEPDGIVNLKNEYLYSDGTCFLVGNVVIDNLINNFSNIESSNILTELNLKSKSYCLVTIHRPSNVDSRKRLGEILKYLSEVSEKIQIVIPLHPRTRGRIEEFGYGNLLKNIKVCEPLGYFEYIHLLKESRFVVTDSGGTQEESTHLKIPCITLRSNTERPITLFSGSSVLAGEDLSLLEYFVRLGIEGRLGKGNGYELWDGKASERILNILSNLMG